MNAFLGSLVDTVHALLMIFWIVGLPLLFWHRWPSLTSFYSIFSLSFITLSQGSKLLFGECFLTSIAGYFWKRSDKNDNYNEWFTVRFAKAVFNMSPSHRTIVLLSEILIALTALGVLLNLRAKKQQRLCH